MLEREKQQIGKKAALMVESGMVLGLGTGSTVLAFMQALGKRIHDERLILRAIASSRQSRVMAQKFGIPLCGWDEVLDIDLCIDGVDEIDPAFNMIKGGGGALLWEKIIASAASRRIYMADSSKLVKMLGKFPLPVEVVPFGHQHSARRIEKHAGLAQLRMQEGKPYQTDSGNLIYDCHCNQIADPAELQSLLIAIPGVVETGLFSWISQTVITIQQDQPISVDGAGQVWWG